MCSALLALVILLVAWESAPIGALVSAARDRSSLLSRIGPLPGRAARFRSSRAWLDTRRYGLAAQRPSEYKQATSLASSGRPGTASC
ncbi:MAG: hypothetical protein ABIR94_14390 [Rubrivivax sp.]